MVVGLLIWGGCAFALRFFMVEGRECVNRDVLMWGGNRCLRDFCGMEWRRMMGEPFVGKCGRFDVT